MAVNLQTADCKKLAVCFFDAEKALCVTLVEFSKIALVCKSVFLTFNLS